jgi:hypothetical protein
MNTAEIITHIDAEISRLQQAKALLTETPLKRGPGRPKSVEQPVTVKPKGRAAISAAAKARWAQRKKT